VTTDQSKNLPRWFESLAPDYMVSSRIPWITFDAFDYLDANLSSDLRIFEWGSGGSTLYWLRRNASLIVSIEHDPQWFSRMSTMTDGSSNLDYRLVLPEILPAGSASGDRSDPDAYVADDPGFSGYTFQRYAAAIDSFPVGYFDLVMIDGRARPACIKHGSVKVRTGGFLVLDNADRPYYLARTAAYLIGFECQEFPGLTPAMGALCQTNIYTRMK
jgi:hypothetical protein